MSRKHSFIPRVQAERVQNGKQFIDQLAVDGAVYGIDAGEVTEITGKFTDFSNAVAASVAAYAARQQQTQTTNDADHKFETLWRTLAAKMKVSSAYTLAVGERYKIVGDEISIDKAAAKPVLKLSKVPSGWQIDFNLQGYFDGVKIYRKRPADASFTYLATDTSSPYIDTDTQVNGTQYMAFFLWGDDAVGVQSDVVTVQV